MREGKEVTMEMRVCQPMQVDQMFLCKMQITHGSQLEVAGVVGDLGGIDVDEAALDHSRSDGIQIFYSKPVQCGPTGPH